MTQETMADSVPDMRIRSANSLGENRDGEYVMYWMTAFRRTRFNFALQYAVDRCLAFQKPLLILEPLRLRYRWASDRFHRFIIQGMQDNQEACDKLGVAYFPYVELEHGQGRGLVERIAKSACVVVTDDYPCFFHPHMIRAAAKSISVRLDAVDSNCLMPLAQADRTFTVAHSYRRWMQKELPKHLESMPEATPLERKRFLKLQKDRQSDKCGLKRTLRELSTNWPPARTATLLSEGGLSNLPIDHQVGPGFLQGGAREAERLLTSFLDRRLGTYDVDRNEPDELGSSELSPHLHFGHIASHEVFLRVMERQNWNPGKIEKPNGKVNGFWGVDENAEAFLDQLCTWREIGFNMTWREPRYDRLDTLPDWTKATIQAHRDDPRPYIYSLEEFERAETHDEIWNSAQRQLVREGRIHNYLRMLWGKKILHWTRSVEEALDVMIELNNKYALDGRDPNSYSGIFWVLGRYDRAWGPEREIFGKIRYMTSENTAKKHKLGKYLERFAR